jgi:hypothetical protein
MRKGRNCIISIRSIGSIRRIRGILINRGMGIDLYVLVLLGNLLFLMFLYVKYVYDLEISLWKMKKILFSFQIVRVSFHENIHY